MEKNFESFVEISKDSVTDKYENMIYVNDEHKICFSTNGSMLLARRDMYDQVKCTLKLLGSEAGKVNNETNAIDASGESTPQVSSMVDSNIITKSYEERFRIKLPSFLNGVSKKKKNPVLYFSLKGKELDLSLTKGDYMLNIQLLSKIDLTQEYDFWFSKEERKPVYILPKGADISTTEYFWIVAPMTKNPDEPSITRI